MTLSWNEIKDRAVKFSKEWKNTTNEEADPKPFLDAFFNVFGITLKKIGTFEHRVKKLSDADDYIDLLWKWTILVEIKSRGKNLDKAVDATYSKQAFTWEAKRMEFLFELYEKYTAGLFVKEKKGKKN